MSAHQSPDLRKVTDDLDTTVNEIHNAATALIDLSQVCGNLNNGAPSDLPYSVLILLANNLHASVEALRRQRDVLFHVAHGEPT